jgi:hypothetical protein
VLLALAATTAGAISARDLSGRIRIDGFTGDFAADEAVFGFNPASSSLEEATDDSRWGVNNDLNQIRVTWDSQYLYLGVEGRIWDNNMVLLLDTVPGRGISSMTQLNSWRRNFDFDVQGGFQPDLFAATWDGNTSPRLIVQLTGNQVDDQRVGPTFDAVATFQQGNPDRAMEFRIPWRTVFLAGAGLGTRDTLIAGISDTLRRLPLGVRAIRLCGVVTAGGDGTGGPDSAPDNLRGHSDNSGDLVFLDNFASIELDRNDDTGLGAGGPDGVADWGVSPQSRVSFRFRPPIVALRFAVDRVELSRPAFSPSRGEKVNFRIELDQRLDPNDPVNQVRNYNLSSTVYDMNGRLVRTLYTGQTRAAVTPAGASPWVAGDEWDGRDQRGQLVTPGIYVIRSVIEPNLSRALRSVVVVR